MFLSFHLSQNQSFWNQFLPEAVFATHTWIIKKTTKFKYYCQIFLYIIVCIFSIVTQKPKTYHSLLFVGLNISIEEIVPAASSIVTPSSLSMISNSGTCLRNRNSKEHTLIKISVYFYRPSKLVEALGYLGSFS